MFVATVLFRSVSDRAEDFHAALRENAATSLRDEAGCQCTAPSDPALFFLYELYDDEAAFEVHKATWHFKQFDDLVRDWTVEKTVKTYVLDPGNPA